MALWSQALTLLFPLLMLYYPDDGHNHNIGLRALKSVLSQGEHFDIDSLSEVWTFHIHPASEAGALILPSQQVGGWLRQLQNISHTLQPSWKQNGTIDHCGNLRVLGCAFYSVHVWASTWRTGQFQFHTVLHGIDMERWGQTSTVLCLMSPGRNQSFGYSDRIRWKTHWFVLFL